MLKYGRLKKCVTIYVLFKFSMKGIITRRTHYTIFIQITQKNRQLCIYNLFEDYIVLVFCVILMFLPLGMTFWL